MHFKEPCFKCLECQQHFWEGCQTVPDDFDPTDYGHGCKDLLLLIHVGIPRIWMKAWWVPLRPPPKGSEGREAPGEQY